MFLSNYSSLNVDLLSFSFNWTSSVAEEVSVSIFILIARMGRIDEKQYSSRNRINCSTFWWNIDRSVDLKLTDTCSFFILNENNSLIHDKIGSAFLVLTKNYLSISGRYLPIADKERGNNTRHSVEEWNAENNKKRRECNHNHCAFLLQMIIPIPMYFNESASIISNGNERLLFLCDQTISFWLFFHLCYVWYITLFILFTLVTPLVAIGQYLSTWYQCDRRRIEDFSVYERSNSRLDRFCRYIHYEVRLMFTYVSVAFALTWLMSNRSIHWMTISHWFIEASLIPYTLVTIVTVYLNFQSVYFFLILIYHYFLHIFTWWKELYLCCCGMPNCIHRQD